MGADLYINKIEDKIAEQYPYDVVNEKDDAKRMARFQQREDAHSIYNSYYRDSYNDSNLMWLIGFSYWKTPQELGWEFNEEGDLTLKGIEQFLNYLKDNTLQLSIEIGKVEDEMRRVYFNFKLTRLIHFLNTAKLIGSTVGWSV